MSSSIFAYDVTCCLYQTTNYFEHVFRDHSGSDHMVVEFIPIYGISNYHH
jgi:hypothetical protein